MFVLLADSCFEPVNHNHFIVQKKEKMLKKQQREALLLDSYLTSDITTGRSLRDRKPVTYTFGKSPLN